MLKLNWNCNNRKDIAKIMVKSMIHTLVVCAEYLPFASSDPFFILSILFWRLFDQRKGRGKRKKLDYFSNPSLCDHQLHVSIWQQCPYTLTNIFWMFLYWIFFCLFVSLSFVGVLGITLQCFHSVALEQGLQTLATWAWLDMLPVSIRKILLEHS